MNIFSLLYAKIDDESFRDRIERAVVYTALFLFGAQLLLIYGSKVLPFNFLEQFSGLSPFSAIQTAFNLILLFEIFLLVLYLAKPAIVSVKQQFQIVSIIIVANIFKTFSLLQSASEDRFFELLTIVAYQSGIALGLFFLMMVFKRQSEMRDDETENRLIPTKQAISIILLVALLAYLVIYLLSGDASLASGIISTEFYKHIFTAIIYVDVVLLLLSFLHTNNYAVILRNSLFIVAVVLVRFAFPLTEVWQLITALGATLLVMGTLAIFSMESNNRKLA